MADRPDGRDPWSAEEAERDRRRRWAATTPQERLQWLERAIRFAGSAGTLPRPPRPDRPDPDA